MSTLNQQQQQFNILDEYDLPKWSGKPQHQYFLEIIKNGATIGEKKINEKQFYLIGKFDKVSDIVLEHPSISRKHALIQFKNNGEVFMYDLGSTHGTLVNRKKLPAKIYHKLNVYDTLQFGMSTRMYILRCQELEEQDDEQQEEQLQKENPENKDKEQENETKSLKEQYMDLLENDPYYKHEQKKKKRFTGGGQQQDGISWGQVDEEEVYQFQENDMALEPQLLKRLTDLTEKQVEKIEKYELKLRKYRGQEEELQALVQREKIQYGLEQKQQEQKQKLQEKVMELGAQVEQAEQAIRASFFGEDIIAMQHDKNESMYKSNQMEDTFGDDDFYDRSIKQNKTNNSELFQSKLQRKIQNNETTTENYWNLKKRLESLIKVRHHYNMKILEMKDDDENLDKKQDGENQDEEDELEKFMKETGHKVNEENKQITIDKLKDINTEIDQVTSMLSQIKPDLKIKNKESDNIEDIFGGDEEEEVKQQDKKQQQKKQDSNNKPQQEKKQEQQQQEFQMPKTKISSTLNVLKKVKKNHQFEEDDEDFDGEMDDEQLLKMAGKQLEREKQYLQKIGADQDEEEMLEEKRLDFLQGQYFKQNNENVNKKQAVFDMQSQGIQKSRKKQKEEQKQKQEEERKKKMYDNIVIPFENE